MALLGDDDVALAACLVQGLLPLQMLVRSGLGLAIGEIIFVAIDEEDDVGVLLDRARFAQIGELGALVLAIFHLTRELGEGDDRNGQLLGERLQACRDLGDLLHAVFRGLLGGAGHQLNVVDDHQIKAALALQAPCPSGELGDRDAAGLVDIERDLAHHLGAGDQLLEISIVDLAASDLRRGDLRLLGNDTGGELFGRHFEREEADDAAILGLERAVGLFGRLIGGRDVEGDIGDEGRLAHGRTSSQNDQVGRLKAAHLPVESLKPRRDAGQAAIAILGRGRHLNSQIDRVAERLEAAIVTPGLCEFEEPALGILDLHLRLHVERGVIGQIDDVFAETDQRAANGEVVDRAAIVAGVDDGRRLGRKPGEILGDRQIADPLFGRQEGFDRDRIGDLAHPHHFGDLREDVPMQRFVEISIVVDENGAEQGLFGLQIVRRLAIKRLLVLFELA